jgi:pullulanase/glycogen debranching enzyme
LCTNNLGFTLEDKGILQHERKVYKRLIENVSILYLNETGSLHTSSGVIK